MVAAAQATKEYNVDDSALGRVKELVGDLQTRLDVAERLANAEPFDAGEIPIAQTNPGNILDQISEHFSPKPTAKAELDKPHSDKLVQNAK